jgi:hypothetical protein
MVSNRIIRPMIVICLLSATVMLGGCSPPLPRTWLPPAVPNAEKKFIGWEVISTLP